jgi:hypothetical protein
MFNRPATQPGGIVVFRHHGRISFFFPLSAFRLGDKSFSTRFPPGKGSKGSKSWLT